MQIGKGLEQNDVLRQFAKVIFNFGREEDENGLIMQLLKTFKCGCVARFMQN